MRPHRPLPLRHAASAALCLAVWACSPALNWREVPVAGLRTMLPCKPDHAQRPVELDGTRYTMDMHGCEAGGGLFAVSHVQAASPAQAEALLTALRAASLVAVQAASVHPMDSAADAATSRHVQVEGRRADGTALQVRYQWLVRDRDVYQLAVYADRLRNEHTETFMGELRFQ